MPISPVAIDAPDQPIKGPLITPGYIAGFAVVASLFFLWAIANNFNDILIRQFQKALDLDRAEAGFIQFVFYLGYFLMALPAGMVMRRLGYRGGILAGLGLYAVGALIFYPAAEVREYWLFLVALFVIASGAAFLETAANPYIVAFGDPSRASQRLNLAQAFNGVGAFIAPIIGGRFIFSGVEHDAAALTAMSGADVAAYRAAEASMVQTPYLILAVVVLLVAAAVAFVKLPTVATATDEAGGGAFATLGVTAFAAAVAAQFFYVGAQVGVWSFFIDYTKHLLPDTPERTAAYLLSVSLVLFMAGRFIGAALMQRIAPATLLGLCATANLALTIVAALAPGMVGVVAMTATGLFMSIMFPTIFALGLGALGDRAARGAPLLIMAIIGGAVFPPLMGLVSTRGGTIQLAMLLPAVAFLVVLLYARVAGRAASATPPSVAP